MRSSGTLIPRSDIEWLVKAMAALYQLPVEASLRQVEVYSGFEVLSFYEGSKRRGLMGVTDEMAKKYRIKHKDWRDNVAGGLRVMAELRKQFDGDYARALGAYQIGVEPMKALIAEHGPRWGKYLKTETYDLIERVVNDRKIERN